MLTKDSKKSANNDPVPTFTLTEMHQHWRFSPIQNIADLFYRGGNNQNNRIMSYLLHQERLTEMLDNVDEQGDINFRIYMAGNPDIPYGTVNEEQPSFTPIIQLFNTDSPPTDISTNAFIPDESSFVMPNIEITPAEAARMIKDWKDYFKADLSHIFDSQGVRIDFTTFDASDSGAIRTLFELPSNKRILYIHLGYEIPTGIDHPFGFRIILEAFSETTSGDTRLFFELSNPCPPACQR